MVCRRLAKLRKASQLPLMRMLSLKDFHRLSQDLLLWLASAESRRQKARVIASPEADREVLLQCQKELTVSVCHRTTSLSASPSVLGTTVP